MPPLRSNATRDSTLRGSPISKKGSRLRKGSSPEKGPKRPTKEDLEKFAIRFEGPVSPKSWPERYRHHFQVIRNIWASRYDVYDQMSERHQAKYIDEYRESVKKVLDNAATFRENTGRNELTWRGSIEYPVLELFRKPVRCHCGRELREIEYQAEPFSPHEKEKLKGVRRERELCTNRCRHKSTIIVDDHSDEEIGKSIFDNVSSQRVVHDTEDKLGRSGIPMAPDRVFGLQRTPKLADYMRENRGLDLVHNPMYKDSLAYPFLVLEAKKESDTPGFRSIEAQTAFPIRRFLRIQEDLKNFCQADFDPLVWYFAYQGEIWQLSAATIQDKKTRVFELWLGNIESEDSALQLVQIINYIWTWARDIFRHNVFRCLAALPGPVKKSPSFTVSERVMQQEASAFSERTPESVQISGLANPGHEQSEHGTVTLPDVAVEDASSHPFLRWSERRNLSKDWALHSTIRHGDIVMFSFRVFEVPGTMNRLKTLIFLLRENAQSTTEHLLGLMQQDNYTLLLKRKDISQMGKHWTGIDGEPGSGYKTTKGDEDVKAVVFFQSYCRSSDWQIVREMYCIIWTPSAVQTFNRHFKTEIGSPFEARSDRSISAVKVVRAFQQLRSISGKLSVAFALGNIGLILHTSKLVDQEDDQLDWHSSRHVDFTSIGVEQLTSLYGLCVADNMNRPYRHHSYRLLSVFRSMDQGLVPLELMEYSGEIVHEKAVVAIKPKRWVDRCPRFCLFVFVAEGFDDESILRSMLRHTYETGALLAVKGQEGQKWTDDDSAIFTAWKDSFSEKDMLA